MAEVNVGVAPDHTSVVCVPVPTHSPGRGSCQQKTHWVPLSVSSLPVGQTLRTLLRHLGGGGLFPGIRGQRDCFHPFRALSNISKAIRPVFGKTPAVPQRVDGSLSPITPGPACAAGEVDLASLGRRQPLIKRRLCWRQ